MRLSCSTNQNERLRTATKQQDTYKIMDYGGVAAGAPNTTWPTFTSEVFVKID